jgi:formylglycine-generating enzyme required for sulfatase activity
MKIFKLKSNYRFAPISLLYKTFQAGGLVNLRNMTSTLIFILFSCNFAKSNNIAVTNVSLTGQDTSNNYTLIEFDLAWDNSWRLSTGAANWDAAWLFIKYRRKNQTAWNHASLHWVDGTGSGDGHSEPSGTNIASSNDNGSGNAKGVFLYRSSALAQSSVNYSDVQLRWEYGDDGLSDTDSVEVCVLAIEMVYVPQGTYSLGSGGSETSAFYKYPTTGNTYSVTSESAITIGTSTGNLYYPSSSWGGDRNGPIPAGYPKGYNDFYCMKYEISQDQYTQFLNKLTSTQDGNRFPNQNGNKRHAITGSAGSRTTTNGNGPCSYLSWGDLAAYLDWAALRPYTELEFEKASRGTATAVSNEYVWGTTNVATSQYSINNASTASEGVSVNYSTTAGNATYKSTSNVLVINGPLRCGIFAAHTSNTSRVTAGASYYGIMELGGSLWGRVVSCGNSAGRAFDGKHGDGVLDANGNANTANWPGTNASGAGLRGGYWLDIAVFLRTSDRTYSATTNANRHFGLGGRGAKTAP